MCLCPVHVGKAGEERALLPLGVSQLVSAATEVEHGRQESVSESLVSRKRSEHPAYR